MGSTKHQQATSESSCYLEPGSCGELECELEQRLHFRLVVHWVSVSSLTHTVESFEATWIGRMQHGMLRASAKPIARFTRSNA